LNDSERKLLQTNKGVVITSVIDDSPAFNADALIGDIITGINGQPVNSSQEFSSVVLPAYAGQNVTLSIQRGQRHLEKSVQLLSNPPVAPQLQGTSSHAVSMTR
jgi:S1-C subfamily serine protease